MRILPIDSEHNAVHQCMRGGARSEVRQIWLTASGGPFRNTPLAEFDHITPAQALKHPTWVMGQRITIDSATMMNKGFEIIEACRLFDLPPAQVRVTIHPQSTVHSLVEFVDGSILAQISVTDMRLPILYALAYPERPDATPASGLAFDLAALSHLDFSQPDPVRFPCLRLAYEAAECRSLSLHCAERRRRELRWPNSSKVAYLSWASRVQSKGCWPTHPPRRPSPFRTSLRPTSRPAKQLAP